MSYNKTTYDYLVFYYDASDFYNRVLLKDLYSRKADLDLDNALSKQELDFIGIELKDACDKVSQMFVSYFSRFDDEDNYPDVYGVLGYEYGKLNIDPDNSTLGDIIVYRPYFSDDHRQDAMLERIDSAIQTLIEKTIRHAWVVTNGLNNWQLLQSEMIQAQHRLEMAINTRKKPTRIASTYY